MRGFFAIAWQTVLAGLRSRVYALVLLLLLAAVFVLPWAVKGDGTARGEVQIVLVYSLSCTIVLSAAATLWVGCSRFSREIETYRIHMVVSKPLARWRILLAKWFGVAAMHSLLFVAAAACIYWFALFRLARSEADPMAIAEVRTTMLTGRRSHLPQIPDFRALAEQEYQRRLEAGEIDGSRPRPLVLIELRRQLEGQFTEVPLGVTRLWRFEGVSVDSQEEALQVRFRVYVGSKHTDQRLTSGVWGLLDPASGQRMELVTVPGLNQVMGGLFQEFRFPGRFVDSEGRVVVAYRNQDPEGSSVHFQTSDGPELLQVETGFLANYSRAVGLVVVQLAFLALLGVVCSALFHTPVAVFLGGAYMLVGVLSNAVVSDFDQMRSELSESRSLKEWVARGVAATVVTPEDFMIAQDLTQGRLIEWRRLGTTALGVLVLRGVPLGILGGWLLERRELGKVIRQ